MIISVENLKKTYNLDVSGSVITKHQNSQIKQLLRFIYL